MTPHLLPVTLIITAFLPALLAQPDYLVNTRGDTLRGQISLQKIAKVDQAVVKGVKKEAVSAIQVREVWLKGVRYKPVQYTGTISFMQILSEGYLSLLGFQQPGLMSYDGRLLHKRDGAMLEVPTLGFKKQMANFLKEDEGLAKQIQDGTLDRKELDKIIAEYNSFISGRTITAQVQTKIDQKQKSKLELLSDLKTELGKIELDSKADVLDMIADVEEKIKSNKPVPAYLINALKSSLESKSDLKIKLNEFIGAL